MTSGDSRGKVSETSPGSFKECYGLFENFADKDQSLLLTLKDAEQCDSWQQFKLFPPESSEISYGAYASFGLEATSDEINGHQKFDGGYDAHTALWINDTPLNWRLPYPSPSRRSTSPYSDSEGSQYSSFSDLSNSSTSLTVPYTKPAPIGSRGREMSQYQWRGRDADTAGTCCVKSRGFCRLRTAANIPSLHSNSAPTCRGTKRILMTPGPPNKFVKKQKLVGGASKIDTGEGLKFAEDSPISSDGKETILMAPGPPSKFVKKQKFGGGACKIDTGEVEERRVRIREKRRRRREKNCEKYGDKHRLAFTCAFCKFRTFEDKDIEKHFRSSYHHETLEYIRRHAKFDDRAISFLHDCMVYKFRKTVSALRKLRTLMDQKTNQKVMEGVTEDDYMRKVEMVHCMACETYIPAVCIAVQQHLSSPLHFRSKVVKVYKEQLKRESVLTAKAIINNDSVKIRYAKYMKGEDPFVTETKEETSFDLSDQERPDYLEYD